MGQRGLWEVMQYWVVVVGSRMKHTSATSLNLGVVSCMSVHPHEAQHEESTQLQHRCKA